MKTNEKQMKSEWKVNENKWKANEKQMNSKWKANGKKWKEMKSKRKIYRKKKKFKLKVREKYKISNRQPDYMTRNHLKATEIKW